MAEIRYGVIGAGNMGQEHIRYVDLLDGATVAAIADPSQSMREASAALAGGGVDAFADYREMISADRCDAYVVATPNDTHFAVLGDILETRKPILCEKPLCTDVDHCREVIRRAAGREAPVWVAMEYRYTPPLQRLIDEVRAGTVGTPRMMAIREHRYPFLDKVDDWNRFNVRTGGTLVEKCCHFWDLMRLTLNSDPVRIYASGGADVNHRDEVYDGATPDILDNAYAVVDFASGARAMLDLCMFAESGDWQETVTVTGDKARVEAFIPGPARFSKDEEARQAEFAVSDRAAMVERREIIPVDDTLLRAGDHHGATFFQHQRFLQMMRAGAGRPDVTLEDGLWAVYVGAAAEESVRTGQPVKLESPLR